jgi:hypothetical protein
MLIWIGTVVSAGVAVTITVRHRRRHRATAAKRLLRGALYLDDNSVMDLYEQYSGKYRVPLESKVEHKTISTRMAEIIAKLSWVGARGHRGVNNEVIRTWVEKATPISVIGTIIDVLDEADDIVEVDLHNCEIVAHHALASLTTAGDKHLNLMQLRDIKEFVLVRGRFRMAEQIDSTTTFQAPYGDPKDPTVGTQMRVTCAASGLRGFAVPTGCFPACCLGYMQDWRSEERCLVLHPVAIFW